MKMKYLNEIQLINICKLFIQKKNDREKKKLKKSKVVNGTIKKYNEIVQ